MIQKRIQDIEERYERRPSAKMAVGLALRQWLTYAVSDVPDPREYLHKANHTVISMLRKNESDLRLFWPAIYFAIELGHFDKANEMLDNAYAYRSFYKSNQPLDHKILHFLYALLEIRQKRAKSARKHMQVLSNGTSANEQLMLGILHLAFYEYEEAYSCLEASYNMGGRSVFLWAALFNYYRTAPRTQLSVKLLLQTVHWAINHDANAEGIIIVYQDELLRGGQIELGERIYQKFPNQWVLKELCSHYIGKGDYGAKAYSYFRDAERRQVYLHNLSHHLIRAAYFNGADRVQSFTMTQYLRKPDDNIPLLIYVYHLLLTDPLMSTLAAQREDDMLEMAEYCLQREHRGRYANSIYYFFWIKCNEQRITGDNVTKIEEILREDLYKFEIIGEGKKSLRHLYINEWEKNGIAEYEFPEEGALVINAIGSGFRYVGLSANRASVLDERLEIRRKIASAGIHLYHHFYRQGVRDFEIIAYLAKAYIQSEENMDETEDAESTGSDLRSVLRPILETVINSKEASAPFKTQCSVALGQLHYRSGRFEQALEYYRKADENSLNNELLAQLLSAYIQQQDYDAAAGLIARRGNRIKDRALFAALRPLAVPFQEEWHSSIAKAAYGVLIKARYDRNILDVVIKHFNGTHAQWLSLSKTLTAISVEEPLLDELILKNAVWGHHFDEDSQRIFAKIINRDILQQNQKCVQDFIYFAVYEMLIKQVRPLDEAISALESLCTEDTELLAYGLSHVYLGHNISSRHSDKIIEIAINAQEKSGLLFPIFKSGKSLGSTYIEKYRPFMYKGLPGKNVYLYYRVAGEEEWRGMPMDYWRFGLYLTRVPHFYNETISYYFSEELPTGSITTRLNEVHNSDVYMSERVATSIDPFFTINNASIYEQMFRYEQVEDIVGSLVKDVRTVRSRLM